VIGLGPYNEHLTRDVGGLYLALLAISLWAVLRPSAETFGLVGAGWLVFSVPHLIFHLNHLDMLDTANRIGNVVALGGTLMLAVLLLWPASRSGPDRDVTSARAVSSSVRQPEQDVAEGSSRCASRWPVEPVWSESSWSVRCGRPGTSRS
jgi:hypothetical protein